MKHFILSFLLFNPSILLIGQIHNLINEGVRFIEEGNFEKAIKILSQAIEQDPKSTIAYFDRAAAYSYSGDYQKAYEDYSTCIKLNPSDPQYYQSRINVAEELNNFNQIVADYNVLIKMYPRNFSYLQNLGTHHLQQKHYGEAILNFSKLIDLNPNNKYALFQRAYSYSALKQNENALEDYNRVLTLDPNDQLALNNRANCHMDLENWKEAKHDYELLLKRYPDHENASVNIKYIDWKLNIKADPKQIKTKYWVLSVGISKYQNPSIMTSLASPTRYAFEFSSVVKVNPYIASLNIPVLTDDAATKSSILKKIKSIFLDSTKVGRQDVIIFYFSGHGKVISDRIGICPYDYFDQRQLITETEIVKIMELSPAKYKIFINESCRSDNSFVGPTPSGGGGPYVKPTVSPDVIIISSTQHGNESYELPDLGAVFSYFLVKAFAGEADINQNKIITISELFQFLRENVYSRTSGLQIPQIISNFNNHEVPIMHLKN